jgi:hypothetical protein
MSSPHVHSASTTTWNPGVGRKTSDSKPEKPSEEAVCSTVTEFAGSALRVPEPALPVADTGTPVTTSTPPAEPLAAPAETAAPAAVAEPVSCEHGVTAETTVEVTAEQPAVEAEVQPQQLGERGRQIDQNIDTALSIAQGEAPPLPAENSPLGDRGAQIDADIEEALELAEASDHQPQQLAERGRQIDQNIDTALAIARGEAPAQPVAAPTVQPVAQSPLGDRGAQIDADIEAALELAEASDHQPQQLAERGAQIDQNIADALAIARGEAPAQPVPAPAAQPVAQSALGERGQQIDQNIEHALDIAEASDHQPQQLGERGAQIDQHIENALALARGEATAQPAAQSALGRRGQSIDELIAAALALARGQAPMQPQLPTTGELPVLRLPPGFSTGTQIAQIRDPAQNLGDRIRDALQTLTSAVAKVGALQPGPAAQQLSALLQQRTQLAADLLEKMAEASGSNPQRT